MGLQTSISDSIVQALRLPEQRIEQELRRELAIVLYTQDILSFDKAHELAEMDKYELGSCFCCMESCDITAWQN